MIAKWVYIKIIVGSWLIVFALAFVMASLSEDAFAYAWALVSLLILLVLAGSYIIIIVTVQRSNHSQHHGSIHTERKLSVTLSIVTGVSVHHFALGCLPFYARPSMETTS